ncbi:hypothetical protein H4J02_02110 [Protaetiibacter sp. SSC-01]|uniref:hypothetical protein n=1 Tax=Protaetiibacter sp. SSC-01 TaxID=2759943 RepID=UPI00165720EC|nr:hypothetical protein [Protaetiibacter sp. SSC-01]QNO37858.1 hypothetical protein H4J02_02110 [Protaetiibacter sp. SSC-01]
MLRNTVDSARPRLTDDTGAAAPTPLFLAYVVALVLSALAAFRGGVDTRATVDFLLLAAIVTGSALVLFAGLMIWSTRGGQRAVALAAARPGAVVLRAMHAHGLRRAVRSLRVEAQYVPIGLTLLADDSGFEVWSGSAEHPVRLGRTPWDGVVDVRVGHVSRLGRATDGLVVTVVDGDRTIELPFAVVGAGFGGLWAPGAGELERFVAALHERRTDFVHA